MNIPATLCIMQSIEKEYMRLINLKFITVVIIVIYNITALAAMPKILQGTWVVDSKASEAFMKSSPTWKASDEKFLSTVMKRMSLYMYTFDGDTISVSVRNKKQTLKVVLIKGNTKKYLFDVFLDGKVINITVDIRDNGIISIQSSSSDDMKYYLWKRGIVNNDTKIRDQKLSIEILKKTLNNR